MANSTPTQSLTNQAVISLLREILQRIEAIERDVDQIDRVLRPYGDGTKARGRG